MNKYEKVCHLATKALKALSREDNKKFSGAELLDWVKQNDPEGYDEVRNSWGSYLTKAVNDLGSGIIREPGSYGFMMSTTEQDHTVTTEEEGRTPPDLDETPAPSLAVGKAKREQRLYAILAEWLTSKDYQAEDTSSKKNGGAWGNPDVVGIKAEEIVGGTSWLELVSIEAKVSSNNWRKLVFEAVAHKRFADRAYFAFSHGTDEPLVANIPDFTELREYGEKYRVGIVVVFMSTEQYGTLVSEDATAVSELSLDDVRVEEVWPAVCDPVSPLTRDRFLRDVLGITTVKGLHEFGA